MVTPGPRRAQLGFLEVHCDPDRALQKLKRVSTSEGFTPSCRGGLSGKPQELGHECKPEDQCTTCEVQYVYEKTVQV